MKDRLLPAIAAVASFTLVLMSLWLWQNAAALTYTFDKPDIAAWAARSAAIALAAAAQVIIAVLVLGRIYRSDALTYFYGRGAGLIFLMSLSGAIVLVAAGR